MPDFQTICRGVLAIISLTAVLCFVVYYVAAAYYVARNHYKRDTVGINIPEINLVTRVEQAAPTAPEADSFYKPDKV